MALSSQEWEKMRPGFVKVWCDKKYEGLSTTEKMEICGIKSGDERYQSVYDRVNAKGFMNEINQRRVLSEKAFAAWERNLDSENPSPDMIKSAIYYAHGVNISPPTKAQVETNVKSMSFNVTNVRNITALTDEELERLASPDIAGILEAPEEV